MADEEATSPGVVSEARQEAAGVVVAALGAAKRGLEDRGAIAMEPAFDLESVIETIVHANVKDKRESASLASELSQALNARIGAQLKSLLSDQIEKVLTEVAPGLAGGAVEHRPAPGGGVAAARRGGAHFRQAEWQRPDMLSSERASKLSGLSRETLNKRRKEGHLLGLESAKRGVRYPEWQFEDAVLPSMPALLGALAHLEPWGQYLFFTRAEPLLEGQSPLEALRAGRAEDVLRVATLLAEEAATS
jgi:hypothetical protein